jgi:CRP/FNR family transcriptional regulator
VIDREHWGQFEKSFPELAREAAARKLIRDSALYTTPSAGGVVYKDGDECAYLPLVLTGELLLTKYGETGRAITLYRVGPGQSCILSALSILNDSPFPAVASTEEHGALLLIPARVVRKLVADVPAWREFVFAIFQNRLVGLIQLVEEVVFQRLDVRLAELLLEQAGRSQGEVRRTHQDLAVELGSSREVVSRILKDWERRGIVQLRRGALSITDNRRLGEIFSGR